jgi:hypothetical protein
MRKRGRFPKHIRGGGGSATQPIAMSLLSWNCHGLGHPSAVQFNASCLSLKTPRLCFHRRQNIRAKNLKELKEKTSFLSSLCVDCGGEGSGRKGGWFNYAVNRRMGSSAQNHVLSLH